MKKCNTRAKGVSDQKVQIFDFFLSLRFYVKSIENEKKQSKKQYENMKIKLAKINFF